jgi:DNA-directed RNA polymerase delta subunit
MVWDPKTKLVSTQFHVMIDDNFDTVQAPDLNIKQADTNDRLLKTNRYTYDDLFGSEHTYLFFHGGADTHPENLTPTIETCQASFTMTPCSETQQNNSTKNNPNNKSILSMQDLMILHANYIYLQSNRYDFKAYKHLHGIDMQIHSIPKSTKQKAQEMDLSDLHHEEFKIFALEYNTSITEPTNELDHYVNTLQRHNEDFDPGINEMFINNLDPTFYAMQMQNSDVLTHTQMKRQVDANKFIEAKRPEIEGLMDINTFEFIPKINLPPRTRYIDLISTYRCKRPPDGSLNKYKACLCVNGSRKIQGIDYTESFAPVVQWSTIRMVNTLAAMHNLKGKKIDFTQALPQANLKEDIYLPFPAGFEHKNEKWALKLKRNLYSLVQA